MINTRVFLFKAKPFRLCSSHVPGVISRRVAETTHWSHLQHFVWSKITHTYSHYNGNDTAALAACGGLVAEIESVPQLTVEPTWQQHSVGK